MLQNKEYMVNYLKFLNVYKIYECMGNYFYILNVRQILKHCEEVC